ncbi:MAG: 3TM-type holin [Pseudomonadota bacterium]|nr:3TM-type holin [Pseudomonadota bacterium]
MTPDSWKSFAAAWQAHLRQATPAQIDAFIAALRPGEAERLVHAWPLWARRSQLPPPGDWRVWLLMAGRGFGKTRAGAEWVRQLVEGGMARSVALVGDTEEDVRQVMIEGPSGILAVSPTGSRPHWHRSLCRLDWPSGAVARCFSASDPEQLRGPEFDHGWADEIGKWPYEAAWDNLMLALRAGEMPRCLATTTPRPRAWLRRLAAAPDTVVVRGATAENEANLAPGVLAAMEARFGSTGLARQELYGEMVDAAPGALWQRVSLERCRAARRAEAAKLQNEALALALELERERLAAQAGLVAAEAGGASWLQRNWRPITMLSFLGLVVADAFGLLAFRLADQAWLLLQIGLGGYVVGRSVEKISPQITAISNAAPPRQRHGPQAKSRSKSRPASGHAKSG